MEDTHGSVLVLRADDFLLRSWSVGDAAWYVESRDEEVFKWTTEKRDLTVAEAAESINQANNNPTVVSFAIVETRSMEILGNIALAVEEDGNAEIMYWLAPWGRGRGIATNAVKYLCRWAFDALGVERITLANHYTIFQRVRAFTVPPPAQCCAERRQPCAIHYWTLNQLSSRQKFIFVPLATSSLDLTNKIQGISLTVCVLVANATL